MERDIFRFDLQLFAEGDGGADGSAGAAGGEPGGAGDGGAGGGTPSGETGNQAGAGGGQAGGGEEMIPKSQVERAIQARLAQAQRSTGELQRHKTIVDRISSITGQSVEAIEAQLDGLALENEAQRLGVNPQVAQAITQMNTALRQTQATNRQMQLDLEESQLKTNPMFAQALADKDTSARVKEMAMKTGLPLEKAFWLSEGTSYAQNMEKQIEARVTANIQNRMGKGGILTEDTSKFDSLGLDPEELAYCQSTGRDPEEYAALKNMNNIEQYRAHKKKKDKK